MEKNAFIYRVAFEVPPFDDGKSAYYFGCVTAIFDVFTPEQIGANLKELWAGKVSEGIPFSNDKVLITRERVYRKAKKNVKTKNNENEK